MAAGDIALEMMATWREAQRSWHCRIGKVTHKYATRFLIDGNQFQLCDALKLPPDASPAP